MATVAVGRRERPLAVRQTADRGLLRSFLERERLFAAYAICDLEDREFPRTRWGMAFDGDRPIAVGLEYSGLTPQPLFLMGSPPGIEAILREVLRPRAAFTAVMPEHLGALSSVYRVDPGPQMVRMWVDDTRFLPIRADVERLGPGDVGELNRLYHLGFASWLPGSSIVDGVYYGIRIGGRLVSAAGTHVISPAARLGVVGNVFTHVDHRGRGYAAAVTAAVTAELLLTCDQVVLNVRSDNPPALQAYRRIGYAEHVRFEERLIHRIGPPWAGLIRPLRRLFRATKENDLS